MNSYRILLIIGVCALLASIAGGIMLWWPKLENYNSLKDQLSSRKIALEQKQEYYRKVNSDLDKVGNYKEEFSKVDSALPSDAMVSLPILLNFIIEKSSENGLKISQIEGDPNSIKKNDSGIGDFSFMISVKGSYSALKDFLNSLYKNARLFEINSIKFDSPTKESIDKDFNFGISIKTHFDLGKEAQTAGADSLPDIKR
jgi:Tfp pilus assembly protein PilO